MSEMNTKARKAAQHVMMILADNTPHGPAEYKECLKVVTGAIAGYFSPGMAELLELRKQRDAALRLAEGYMATQGEQAILMCVMGEELRAIFAPKEGK